MQRLLVSGEADGVGVSLPELLAYWIDDIPLMIVLPLDSAAGTEGIAVLPDSPVQSVSDLRQQRIAVEQRGILNFVLVNALRSAGLELRDVQPFERNASQVARELASGTLQVGLTREPHLSSLVQREQARLIYTSDELEGLIVGTLAIAPKAIEKKAAVVQFLVDGVLKARRFIAEQPEQAMEIIAQWENQPSEVTQANLRKITLFDTTEMRRYFEAERLAEQLKTFEGYLESIGQPLPLVTPSDLAVLDFFDQAVASDRPKAMETGKPPVVAEATGPSTVAPAPEAVALPDAAEKTPETDRGEP